MLSRRALIKGAAATGAGLFLAACGDGGPDNAGIPSGAPVLNGQVKPVNSPDFDTSGLPTLSLDQELAVPAEWIDGAKQEGKLTITSRLDSDQFKEAIAPFQKRYPFIQVSNVTGTDDTVSVRTLAEFKLGKTNFDIVLGSADAIEDFKGAGALIPLDFAPAWKEYPSGVKDPQNMAIGQNMRFWGIAYNTNMLSAADAPQKWEDLADPRFKGKVAIVDRPSQLMLSQWEAWGDAKATDFLQKFFANQPIRRSEGIGALTNLLAAGEFPIAVPIGINQIQTVRDKGGPVGWISPEPITARPGCVFILSNALHPNAAKIYVSWLLSAEGQASNALAENTVPTLPSESAKESYYGGFGPALNGKQWDLVSTEEELKYLPDLQKAWSKLWLS